MTPLSRKFGFNLSSPALKTAGSQRRAAPTRSTLPRLLAGLLALISFIALGFVGTAAEAQTATLTTLGTNTSGDFTNGVMQASDGNFYSSSATAFNYDCSDNSNNECSYIQKITPSGVVTIFHTFEAPNGGLTNVEGLNVNPIIEAPDGNFYGTAMAGGQGAGVIFRITPAGVLTVLHTFPLQNSGQDAPDGLGPGPLILGNDGLFYGVAKSGGTHDVMTNGQSISDAEGTFFKIARDGTFFVLHTFHLPTTS